MEEQLLRVMPGSDRHWNHHWPSVIDGYMRHPRALKDLEEVTAVMTFLMG